MNVFKFVKEKFFTATNGTILNLLYNEKKINKHYLLQQYNGYVYACVRPIALQVSKAQFYVNQVMADGSKKMVTDNSLIKVINNPNPDFTKTEFLQITATQKKVVGEAFWYMVLGELTGRVKEFHLLQPDRMDVAIGEDENGLPTVTGYVFNNAAGTKVPLDKNSVVHFKEPNPSNPYRGISSVEAGILYVQTATESDKFSRNFLGNSAMPSGIVNFKGVVNQAEFEKLKRQFNNEYSSADNAGKVFFLKNGQAEFQKMGVSLGDIDLQSLKSITRDDVMMMFGVTKPILGLLDDVNLASAKAAQTLFMSNIIDPEIAAIADTLQNVLTAQFGLGLELGYQSVIPTDEDSLLAENTAGWGKWLTTNDIRRRSGLEAREGGDLLYVPMSALPIEESTNVEKSLLRKKSIGTIKVKITQKKNDKIVKSIPVENKEAFRVTVEKLTAQYIVKYRKFFLGLMDKQKAEVIGNLPGFSKAVGNGLFDQDAWDQEITTKSQPLILKIMEDQGLLSLELLGEKEATIKLRQEIIDKAKDSIARMARNYNSETVAKIQEIVKDSIVNKETPAVLKSRLSNDVYGSAMDYRADRVARTEITKAANMGTVEGYKSSGYVTKIEWFANPGACEFCEDMDGKVVSIESSFLDQGTVVTGTNGGQYDISYDTVDGPPLHPNCTCTTLPVRDDS